MPISKPYRTNDDFQIEHFLVGNSKTPDAAWALMYSQKLSMERRVLDIDAQRLIREADIEEQEYLMNNAEHPWERKRAVAKLSQLTAAIPEWEMANDGAKRELATIQRLMDELEPKRKYSHLPLLEAFDAAQREEWKLELIGRVENQMLSRVTGIGWDHLETMRSHPDFYTDILPAMIRTSENIDKMMIAKNNTTNRTRSEATAMLGILKKE